MCTEKIIMPCKKVLLKEFYNNCFKLFGPFLFLFISFFLKKNFFQCLLYKLYTSRQTQNILSVPELLSWIFDYLKRKGMKPHGQNPSCGQHGGSFLTHSMVIQSLPQC